MLKLRGLYNRIMELEDLRPSGQTNCLFSQLVNFAISKNNDELTGAEIFKLQERCAEAEIHFIFFTFKIG